MLLVYLNRLYPTFFNSENERKSERIPLTIADVNTKEGTVTIVVKAVGRSTHEMSRYKEGDSFADVVVLWEILLIL